MEISGYVVLDELGGDRWFRLYRGRHAGDGAHVLLKVPAVAPVRPRDREALEREWTIARSIRGTALPPVRELNSRGDVPCLVFEDDGLDLLGSRSAHGRLPLDWVLSFAGEACTALHELHERKVVLGCLSPSGVLVDDAAQRLRFIDLRSVLLPSVEGLPAARVSEVTAYSSPEQTGRLNRAIDYRCDFYGLGILLYELLVGSPPVTSSDTLELIHWHIAKTAVHPARAAGVPEQVSRIVMRLLAKDPEDRYQSALGVRHDVRECAREWAATGAVSLFDLAQHDVATRFLVPRKLYGRDEELAALTRAFEETCAGQTALLLVGGYSGVGKTSLISELYRPIVLERGYFTSGKVDQVVGNVPYGALAHAFRRLAGQLLSESEERLSRWRSRLSAAIGANGGVLIEVIPELERILGPQPPPPLLGPSEAQNRFRYVFQSFVATLADAEHPLVVFIDDLQWADAATLELLEGVLTEPDVRNLLVIGAYRDNEVDDDHLLMRSTGRLEAAGARVRRMSLAPLDLSSLLAFLVDTLHGDPREVDPLARLILAKTAGNPLFVIQFLKTLVQDGLLTLNGSRWVFRLDEIERSGITDNVVDLMTRRVQRLSPRAQRTLTLAACIGSPFDWQTLLTVSREAPDQVAAGLAEALDAGLIERAGPYDELTTEAPVVPTYSFVHDRVQQAVYGLIPDGHKQPVHLDVGRLLLARCGEPVPDDRLFELANQFNMAHSLVTSVAERRSIARLNLAAARKAKSSTAYREAATYLEHGIALAGEDWNAEFALSFELHFEAAECQYLAGDFERAEQYFRLLLDRAGTRLDRARVHALRITLYEHQSRWEDALASGREGLALFGLAFPASEEEKRAALERELAETRHQLAARSIPSLVGLPAVDDPDVRVVMRILTTLWAPAYLSGDPLLTQLISATMVRLSLAHGNTEDSAYGYVTHAITVGPVRHDYRSAFSWGELALAVNQRFGDARRRAKIHQQFQAHVNLWCRPVGYDEFEPYYTEAEQLYHVHGERGADPTEPPASAPYPHPAVSHEPRIQQLHDDLARLGRRPFHVPLGIMLDEQNSARSRCIRCGTCDGYACLVQAKADAQVCAVDPALESAGVTLLTNAFVRRLETSASGREVTRVVVERNGEIEVFAADIVVVACGAINSAALLLRSNSMAHPDGLANGSGVVGRHYMGHINSVLIALSRQPNPTVFQKTLALNDYYFGDEEWPYPMGHISFVGKLDAIALSAGAPAVAPGWSLELMARHSLDFWLTSEDLPDPQNRVTIDAEGRPVLAYTPNNEEGHRRLIAKLKSLMTHLDMHDHLLPRQLFVGQRIPLAGVAHQNGTIRFGDDPRRSALDRFCRAHDVDNLYVVDGSFFPSSGAVNPALTIMANALRVGDHLKERLMIGQTASIEMQPA